MLILSLIVSFLATSSHAMQSTLQTRSVQDLTPELTHAVLWSYNNPLDTVMTIKQLRQTNKQCAELVPSLTSQSDISYIARCTKTNPLIIAFIAHNKDSHAMIKRWENQLTENDRKHNGRAYSALLAELFGRVSGQSLSKSLSYIVREYGLVETDFNSTVTPVIYDGDRFTYILPAEDTTQLHITGHILRKYPNALHGGFVSPWVDYKVFDTLVLAKQWIDSDGNKHHSFVRDQTDQDALESFKQEHQFGDSEFKLLDFLGFFEPSNQSWVFIFWDDHGKARLTTANKRFMILDQLQRLQLCDGYRPVELHTRADGVRVLYLQKWANPGDWKMVAFEKGHFWD